MRSPSQSAARRVWLITAILAALVLLFPLGVTVAYLTDEKAASPTTGGVGRWCSVPDPAEHPNVYRLSAFNEHTWDDKTRSHIIIVPVARNAGFGPGGGDGRLGVRAWACDADSLNNNSFVKVTAWRNASSSSDLTWLPRVNGTGFPSHRLSPATGFGKEVAELHRFGTSGGTLKSDDRQKYSWMLSSGRSKTDTTKAPPYTSVFHNYEITPNPSFSAAFKGDMPGTRKLSNSVTYLASAYWTGAGTWTGSVGAGPTVQPVKLAQYDGSRPPFGEGRGPISADGRQVEWVVMEWWGSTPPSDDMALEVFVQ